MLHTEVPIITAGWGWCWVSELGTVLTHCSLTGLVLSILDPGCGVRVQDRPRLRTYFSQLIATTTALGVPRVLHACLPIRCGSSNRILRTPGDAIPSNGLPTRLPLGQYRPQGSLSHGATVSTTNRPARPLDSSESPRTHPLHQ